MCIHIYVHVNIRTVYICNWQLNITVYLYIHDMSICTCVYTLCTKVVYVVCHYSTDEDDTSLSTTSSLHVPGPCFSVYELRNKLFQRLSPNSVYIYTYKNQIKSFKLPIHWVGYLLLEYILTCIATVMYV